VTATWANPTWHVIAETNKAMLSLSSWFFLWLFIMIMFDISFVLNIESY